MMSAVAPALLGGACLGVSSVVVLAQTGGILGVSGIVGCGTCSTAQSACTSSADGFNATQAVPAELP